MNLKNNHSFIFLILTTIIVSLNVLCVFQWVAIGDKDKKMRICQRALDNCTKLFFSYQNLNMDVSLENLNKTAFPIKNALIYRFSVDMCDECIQQDIETLYSFQDIVGKQHLMLLPDYPENRNTTIYLSNTLSRFHYKNLPDSVIGFPIHKKTGEIKRYMAYINANGEIASIFYPVKFKQNLTRLYLQQIISKCK